ncbi:hypothetical protein ACHWQZ_G000546 [Mnemiopsis leidyi]
MTKNENLFLLYGKDPQREHIKNLLTSDNVLKKGELYDYDTPCTTTKADDYKAWTGAALKPPQVKQETLKTNISFGSYSGGQSSIHTSDYNTKQYSKVNSFKPTNQINIIDLDPKYQADPNAITSSYAAEFDKDALVRHQAKNKVLIHGSGNPITNYLRATHFSLGSDPIEKKTEAQAAFSNVESLTSKNSVAAERAQQDKRTNNVFRNGDYNITKEPENKSVFSMSYAGIPSTQKGYDHIINSRANIKMDDAKYAISKKLYNYLREKFQNPRDPCQVNLRQAFALFDKKRTGFISYDSLSNVLKRVLDPSDHALVGDIVAQFDLNNDGKIDYLEFESFLNQKFPEVDKEASLYADTYKPSLLEGARRPRSSDNSPVDGNYQINTHFRFGEGVENSESLYKSTFGDVTNTGTRPTVAKPPPPSQMLPVEPEHMKTASSIQREDYHCHFTHLRKIADERAATIRANKSMHENASFAIGNEASQELNMESLTLSSYQPKKSVPCGRARGFESKWNHLTTEDALPELTAGPMVSEHTEAFNNKTTSAHNEFNLNKDLRKARVTDEKSSHLQFGNDSNRGNVSEMAVQFKTPKVNVDYPAAGISGGPIAEHKHIHHSDNQTALSDPSVKSLQDAIKQTILEKCYNPRDPLNVNLQKAFKEFDKNNTGKITVTGLREACKRLQLPVDDATLRRYFICLDKNKDGSIDYHEFADELGVHIQHVSSKGMTTEMKSSYTPISERSQGMETQKIDKQPIQQSHYFHMNNTTATPGTTTQNDFSHPIEKLDFNAYQTVSTK